MPRISADVPSNPPSIASVPCGGSETTIPSISTFCLLLLSTAADSHGWRLKKPAWLLDMPPQEEKVSMFALTADSVLGCHRKL